MSKSTKIRVLVVDDHIVLRMGLISAASNEPDIEVVAQAEDGLEAIEKYRQVLPDVVVLDLRLNKMNGFQTLERLKQEFGDVRVLIFSSHASGDAAIQALNAGARGVVTKEMPLDRLLEGIRELYQGRKYIPPEVSYRVTGRVVSKLSPREIEVLNCITEGLSNKEIASRLKVVEGTVKMHMNSILGKLEVNDRTQALVTAVRRGLIDFN